MGLKAKNHIFGGSIVKYKGEYAICSTVYDDREARIHLLSYADPMEGMVYCKPSELTVVIDAYKDARHGTTYCRDFILERNKPRKQTRRRLKKKKLKRRRLTKKPVRRRLKKKKIKRRRLKEG